MGYGWLARQQLKLRQRFAEAEQDGEPACKHILKVYLIALAICVACMITGYAVMWPMERTAVTVGLLAGLMVLVLFCPALCVHLDIRRILIAAGLPLKDAQNKLPG